jgi:hypothetical protein
MRSRFAPLLLVLSLCFARGQAWADTVVAPVETTWMTVLLNGRKVGHEEIQRQHLDDTVVTTQTLVMDVERSGQIVPYTNVSHTVETTDGQPLSFSMNTTMSASDAKVEGTMQPDGHLQLTNFVGGDVRHSVTGQAGHCWSRGSAWPCGQRTSALACTTSW